MNDSQSNSTTVEKHTGSPTVVEGAIMERYISTLLPHFHVCNGERPHGHFLQEEAWEVNDWVQSHISRTADTFQKP